MFDPSVFRLLGYVLLFLLVAPVFPLLYVALRWRTAGEHEKGTGTYCALLYFLTASLLLTLAGAANLTYGWISTTPVDPELKRLSWGLFIGAGLFLVLNLGVSRWLRLAPSSAPEARRLFAGFLAIMAGLIAVYVLVMFFATVTQEVDPDNARAIALRTDYLKLYGTWLAYYLVLYLVTISRLKPAP